MGIPEYCRMKGHRLRLEGRKRVGKNGLEEVSINGRNWRPYKNGFHREEDPMKRKVIYQAPPKHSDNGKAPRKIEGSLEISASAD